MPNFVQYWARELGAAAESVVQMPGGINNFVYRCETAHCRFILKGYPLLRPGQRDRMQAEVEFLRYAGAVANEYVPNLLHVDSTRRCVVLENLDGSAYAEGVPPPQTDIDAACAFFARLNSDRYLAKRHVHLAAADGHLRLTEHLQNVEERLGAMRCNHLPAEHKKHAVTLLQQLTARVEAVKHWVDEAIRSGQVPDAIDEQQLVVSPSDFGFHNAICTASGVRFIDFEFAGWDDPAKAVTDFMLQPRIPLHFKTSPLLEAVPPATRVLVSMRVMVLTPILRVKWLCLILSVFQPDRFLQLLATQVGMDAGGLVKTRLETATKYLGEESLVGLH
jgi:hypothetical protein